MVPHTSPGRWPEGVSSSRFASRVMGQPLAGARAAILGLPDDEGVRLNGGRPGAQGGPQALRAALARYGAAEAALNPAFPATCDAGDVVSGQTLEETHARVLAAAGALHERGIVPVGIGGGHDLTFPFVHAAANAHGPLEVVYLDPHLDVRAERGSGMPFRALVEAGAARGLHIQGYSAFANSREHRAWFDEAGGRVDDLQPDGSWPAGPLAVSLDLDVIDQAFAPGVSATNPCGWCPARASAWVRAAGRHPGVVCFDIMELNPAFDPHGRTARLAAHLLLEFVAGLAERGA